MKLTIYVVGEGSMGDMWAERATNGANWREQWVKNIMLFEVAELSSHL